MNLTVQALSAAVQNDPVLLNALSILNEHGDTKTFWDKYLAEGTTDEIDGDRMIGDLFQKLTKNYDDADNQSLHLSYYELLLKKHFPENFKFLTLADVQVPKEMSLGEASTKLANISQNMSNNLTKNIELLNDPERKDDPNIANVYAKQVGDKLVVDESGVADHLKFMELVKSVKLEDIYNNPHQTAVKLISYYLETHKSLDYTPANAMRVNNNFRV